MTVKRLLLTMILCLIAAPGWARNERPSGMAAGVAGFDTNIVWQTHDNGYLRSTVTNYGYFGTVRDRLRDSTGALVPVMESPANSGIEYLYEAGLWIGGVVGSDTLVSTGSLGFGIAHELYADGYEPGVRSDFLGDDEWTFVYGDTTTDPETVREDSYDGVHRPLPVRVRQKTYTFDAFTYNGAVYMDLVVTNIGSQPITDAWFGWLVDPDIGHFDTEDYWMDDITGHVQGTVSNAGQQIDISAAWAMDNDGDPDSTGQFNDHSPKRAFGSMYLGGAPALTGESYNWWVPSLRKEWDWGPQRSPGDLNRFGGRGFEAEDHFRYRLMSNGEMDYAQPYSAIDRTAEGWVAPPADSIARNFADGYEIRFLHTVGPTTIAPGDSVVIHWVWCVAPYAHVQPSHFTNTFDADDPEMYLDGLGIDQLAQLMGDLRAAWDSSFAYVPVSPPENFRIAGWTDSSAYLAWNAKNTERLRHYRITRLRQFSFSWTVDRTVDLFGDSTFEDFGLDRSLLYAYSIASYGRFGAPAYQAITDTLLPDRPKSPKRPLANARTNEIRLNWQRNAEPGVIGYRVYRRVEAGDWALIRGLSADTSFVDESIAGAVQYEYRVTAISELANESYPSPATAAVAFSFDGPPQVLDYTVTGPMSLTDKDSVRAAWERLLTGVMYRDAAFTHEPYALVDYNPHPVTIVVSDGRSSLPSTDFSLLDLYSTSQGATIVTGRDLFNRDLVLDSMVTLPKNSLGYAAGIRRAYYPRTLLANPTRMNAEFVGAAPVDPALPHLDVDSTRTDWGLNPALPHPGSAIPFVGYFEIDTSVAEVLYAFESGDGAVSPLHGKPVAVMSKQAGRTLAVFAFPLSYIEEPDARACLAAVLARMGYGSSLAAGDADNDGVVTAADVVSVINYLYRDGYLINELNADVNRDCRVDVLDVIYLLDHVYHGQGLPLVKCP